MKLHKISTNSVDNQVQTDDNPNDVMQFIYINLVHCVTGKQNSQQITIDELKVHAEATNALREEMNNDQAKPVEVHKKCVQTDVSAWNILAPWNWSQAFWSHDLWTGVHNEMKDDMAREEADGLENSYASDRNSLRSGEIESLRQSDDALVSSLNTDMRTGTQMVTFCEMANEQALENTKKISGLKV